MNCILFSEVGHGKVEKGKIIWLDFNTLSQIFFG